MRRYLGVLTMLYLLMPSSFIVFGMDVRSNNIKELQCKGRKKRNRKKEQQYITKNISTFNFQIRRLPIANKIQRKF